MRTYVKKLEISPNDGLQFLISLFINLTLFINQLIFIKKKLVVYWSNKNLFKTNYNNLFYSKLQLHCFPPTSWRITTSIENKKGHMVWHWCFFIGIKGPNTVIFGFCQDTLAYNRNWNMAQTAKQVFLTWPWLLLFKDQEKKFSCICNDIMVLLNDYSSSHAIHRR